ncbi:uncharacterized protein LOC133740797 isoform X1 [Rosa rugosa]|uniref:uncharacterized protein LOC133740797 isoform X1 n=1 Tax=Rosa rugosa TaxID=74645 RepID=UPI002B4077A0|nr:uncharacterized protein LOC133740797 isoform X1 [Rosa rugosa]
MAMAIRSALAKLASNSVHKNRSGILMLRAFAIDKNLDRQSRAVSGFPAGHFFRHRFDYGSYKSKKKELKVFDYYMDLGGLEPARFATEEFNKRKKMQLQFVRVVKAHRHLLCTGISSLYDITLEAVDAGVAKLYQAKVSVNFTDGMFLEWFCLVVDDGCPIALFDHLENFFAQKDNEDRAESQIPMCKKQGLNCSNNLCIKLCRIEPAYDLSNNGKMQKFGRWAVKMYNKEKNAKLQFKRVVNGSKLQWEDFVYLTMEAADAGVMKIYQAELFLPDDEKIKHPNSKLILFGHVDDNGGLSILIDKRHEECTKEILESEDIITAYQQGYCRYKDSNVFLPTFLRY